MKTKNIKLFASLLCLFNLTIAVSPTMDMVKNKGTVREVNTRAAEYYKINLQQITKKNRDTSLEYFKELLYYLCVCAFIKDQNNFDKTVKELDDLFGQSWHNFHK